MTKVKDRLARLEASRPGPPLAPRFDLSQLSDEQFERLDRLRERIVAVGPDGLTPDEMEEAADLVRLVEEHPEL